MTRIDRKNALLFLTFAAALFCAPFPLPRRPLASVPFFSPASSVSFPRARLFPLCAACLLHVRHTGKRRTVFLSSYLLPLFFSRRFSLVVSSLFVFLSSFFSLRFFSLCSFSSSIFFLHLVFSLHLGRGPLHERGDPHTLALGFSPRMERRNACVFDCMRACASVASFPSTFRSQVRLPCSIHTHLHSCSIAHSTLVAR